MAFNNINNQLQRIAKHGNYIDVQNALVLISAFARVYLTGQVPTVRKFRGGKEASTVAGLEAMLTGATSQTNSIHEFNKTRLDFLTQVAALKSEAYTLADPGQYQRMGLVSNTYPLNVNDCQGTLIGSATDDAIFTTLWNGTKVDTDRAVCGVKTPYVIETGVAGYLLESAIQPDNASIPYNAPASVKHRQFDEFTSSRSDIVDREAGEKPQAVAKYNR